MLSVPLKKFTTKVDKIKYSLPNVGDLETDTLYFKKFTMSDLINSESDEIFALRDKIAVAQAEKQLKLISSIGSEGLEKIINATKHISEIEENQKEEEIISMEEIEINSYLEASKNFGLSSIDVIKAIEPIIGRFIFLDKEKKVSVCGFDEKTPTYLKNFSFDKVNVYLFLLAMSI